MGQGSTVLWVAGAVVGLAVIGALGVWALAVIGRLDVEELGDDLGVELADPDDPDPNDSDDPPPPAVHDPSAPPGARRTRLARAARSLRRFSRRLGRALRYQAHAYWRGRPIRANTVLYESFGGNGMLCNPEAVFRALLAAEDMRHLEHVWALSDLDEYRDTIAEFAGNPRVRFVRRGSFGYLRALATSRYLVNNATFPPEFGKRPGQLYLNTWHGTPLKHMGFDMPDGPHQSANTLRNFLAADYLLSASPFMTETMYAEAYKLRGVYRGAVIEEGYPRVDRQFLDEAGAARVVSELESAGLGIHGRRIVVYAPTWRGASFTHPESNLDEILRTRRRLEAALDPSRWCVLLKLHQAAWDQASRRPELRGVLVPNRVPTNLLLGVTDILMTDFSSIFFDFLPTGRPILFYTPDRDRYREERGLYREVAASLPGPVFTDAGEAARALRALTMQAPARPTAAYAAARAAYCPWEDGAATERVVDVVFRGRTDGHRIRRLESDRESVLIHMGGMTPNGITSSAFNMVGSIDHHRFDVSITYADTRRAGRTLATRSLDPAVRHLPRVGGMNGSKLVHLWRRRSERRGRPDAHRQRPALRQLWDDEWTRCFGDARFDHVVDFSGYSPFWATLLLHAPDAGRAIWLHNDMVADAARSVNGRFVHRRNLRAVFRLYRDYDRLVSVSEPLAAINRTKLAGYAPSERFVSAPNCVDAAGILALADRPVFPPRNMDAPEDSDPDPAARRAALLALVNGSHAGRVFVCAGRLSTEKNHARLIRAFARVHGSRPDARLAILGSGPLFGSLSRLVAELGLADAVVLAGHVENPYAAMRRADCFVLSSDYEGQPMVLLEAAVLGLPIVTVDFGSAAGALPAGCALVVPQSEAGLVDGMTAFIDGRVPRSAFDAAAYNGEAVEGFYRAVGLPVPRRSGPDPVPPAAGPVPAPSHPARREPLPGM